MSSVMSSPISFHFPSFDMRLSSSWRSPQPCSSSTRPVGGRRAVEGDLLLGAGLRRGQLLLGGAGDDERRPGDLDVGQRAARLGRAPLERGQRDLAEVALGGEAVAQEAVAHLAGHLGHQLADAGQEDLGVAVRVRARVEERGHQGVRVEVALEVELGAVVPRRPDGADGQDHLPHAGGGLRPRHREALRDVRLDLAAEAEDEAAAGRGLQVPGDLGQVHRVAGEGHGDAGAQLDPLGRPATASRSGKNGSWAVSAVQRPS